MSRRGRGTRVPLDGLSATQLAVLRRDVDDLLIARAEDLRLLPGDGDPGRSVGEVAALGRLASGLGRGEILVPDSTVRELVARRAAETARLEEVGEEYERERSRQEAWATLLAHLPEGAAGGAGATVPAVEEQRIDLPDDQVAILSGEVVGRLVDAAADLAYLDRSRDPGGEVAEVAAWGRLAGALRRRRIALPDPEAARLFRGLAEAIAEGDGHRRIVATHAALKGLMGLLG